MAPKLSSIPAPSRITQPARANIEAMNAKELALLTYNQCAQTARDVAEIRDVVTTMATIVASMSKTQSAHGEELFRRLGIDADTASLAARIKALETTVNTLPSADEVQEMVTKGVEDAKSSARAGAMVGGGTVSVIAEALKFLAG